MAKNIIPSREEIIEELGVPSNAGEFEDELDWQLYWLFNTLFDEDDFDDIIPAPQE